MAWTRPQFNVEEVIWAGRVLIAEKPSLEDMARALKIINNWRSAHAFPLNYFQVILRRKAPMVDSTSLVAQRIKRLPAIEVKLKRFDWLDLYEMQDIGGCRAVLSNVGQVIELGETLKKQRRGQKLDNVSDYLRHPKKDGYRGLHFIFQYQGGMKLYRGMKIEIQVRSRLQHAWATAVETIDTFEAQGLKTGGGHEDWRRFFALMGSAIAMAENCTLVPKTPKQKSALVAELQQLEKKIDAINTLVTYGQALDVLKVSGTDKPYYYLLVLEPQKRTITYRTYLKRQIKAANVAYAEAEKNIKASRGASAVLVSVKSLDALRTAYPNYFLDTQAFVAEIRKAIAN